MTKLEDKLVASSSYSSFQSERSVAKTLSEAGWKTTHGMYYRDLQTQKQRELDVISRQIWLRKHRDIEQACRIILLIEVKSMAGFHLLLSEHPTTSQNFYQHIHWFADSTGKYQELSKQFSAQGIDLNQIKSLIDRTHRYAYPREHARLWSMMVRPQPIPVFTSFRETNFGTDKDLDNSVFWRASHNLNSAHSSIATDIRQNHFESLLGAAEFESKSKNWAKSMEWWAYRQVSIVDIIHPIVVTDAQLWTTSDNGPKQCAYARFGSHTYSGVMDWWCDVVNTNHFAEYAAKLTEHYRKKLRVAKAKLDAVA